MRTLLTIVGAIAFVAIFVFCEASFILTGLAIAVFAICAKVIEKQFLTEEEKNETV